MSYTSPDMAHPAQNKLRTWRMAQEKSVNDAAAEVGCTRQTWHSWESGSNIPSADFMAKLIALTNGAVTANDFYDLPTHSNPPVLNTGMPKDGCNGETALTRGRTAA
jgi:DNA-binding XRE family transcriptional regulator